MPTAKTKIPLAQARAIAERWKQRLQPAFTNLVIAGSIRRQRPEVGDIELVGIPKPVTVPDMFDNQVDISDEVITNMLEAAGAVLNKNGRRQKQAKLPDGTSLELYIVRPPSQFGVQLVLRTGSEEFSRRIVTQRNKRGLLPSHARVEGGAVWVADAPLEMPNESDFFAFCELPYVRPEERN
jgi:DNA polymerase/3'-5' exonuclease PolX